MLTQVLSGGRSLTSALPAVVRDLTPEERSLASALCYGTLRFYPRLQRLLREALHQPLRDKDADVHALLLLGLYQLMFMSTPAHAAVHETVDAARALGKPWAAGLVNAVLRSYQREAETWSARIAADEEAATAHPAWLLAEIKQAWPQQWPSIIAADNEHPPMTLRVNARRTDRASYLSEIARQGIRAREAPYTQDGIILEVPVDVDRLPGFRAGLVSVQDGAAQLAAPLLAAAPGERLLDACTAPGGKTCHILETAPEGCRLWALDQSQERMGQVTDNLQRLGLSAKLRVGDAARPREWWDGEPFDRILLDAPCSATGVIRRHPDIKVLRRPEDIPALAELQGRLLNALWPLLRPGGILLYCTCSVLPQENEDNVQRFLASHPDASASSIEADWGMERGAGRQVLPGEQGMDGFYYARLFKARLIKPGHNKPGLKE